VAAATAAVVVAIEGYDKGVRGERQKADGRQTPCAYPYPESPRSVTHQTVKG